MLERRSRYCLDFQPSDWPPFYSALCRNLKTHRSPMLYLVITCCLQAWSVYFWARFGSLEVSRTTLEWIWLGSLGLVIVALEIEVITREHVYRGKRLNSAVNEPNSQG